MFVCFIILSFNVAYSLSLSFLSLCFLLAHISSRFVQCSTSYFFSFHSILTHSRNPCFVQLRTFHILSTVFWRTRATRDLFSLILLFPPLCSDAQYIVTRVLFSLVSLFSLDTTLMLVSDSCAAQPRISFPFHATPVPLSNPFFVPPRPASP